MTQTPELYWEDFPVGEEVTFGSYLVQKEEMIEFASEFDPQPFHLNEEIAKTSLLGGLATSGWQNCAIAMRIMWDGYLHKSASMGAPGVEEVRWRKPVYAGDVLSMTRKTLESRRSNSRPGMGLVRFMWEMYNQSDELKMTMEGWAMFECRDKQAANLGAEA